MQDIKKEMEAKVAEAEEKKRAEVQQNEGG